MIQESFGTGNVWFCAYAMLVLFTGRLASQPTDALQPPGAPGGAVLKTPAANYLISPNDVVAIKVLREDDLSITARVANDGTIIFPMLGAVPIGGRTVAQAVEAIRELLAKDYLVNPQVNLMIVEFAKRRFTIMGEVQRPGTYDIPEAQSLNLLQAISMAGGYTRLASPAKVVVQRQQGDKKVIFKVDAKSMAKDKDTKVFEVLPDDTITVGESIF